MGKPEVQHCKVTVTYDNQSHDLYANGFRGKWIGADYAMGIDDWAREETINGVVDSASEALAEELKALIEVVGLVIE